MVVSFQREVFANNVLEVNYVGSRGVHLFGGYDVITDSIFWRVIRVVPVKPFSQPLLQCDRNPPIIPV